MDLFRLAWKNIWRNRRRTIITLTAVAFSIMLVQAVHNLSYGVYAGMVDSGVRAGTGHVAVYRSNYLDALEECSFTDATPLYWFLEFSYLETLERVSTFYEMARATRAA